MWLPAISGNGSHCVSSLHDLQQPAKPPAPSLRRKPGERVLSNPAPAHRRDREAPAPPRAGLSLQSPQDSTEPRPGRSVHKTPARAHPSCPASVQAGGMPHGGKCTVPGARTWGGKATQSFQVLPVHVEVTQDSSSAGFLKVSPSGQPAPLSVYLF